MAVSKTEQNAVDALVEMFTRYGLGALASKIVELVQEYGPENTNTIILQLQGTSEYKARFRANEARKKAGLPVLSPAEYIAQESAYRQVMRAAGLPAGFYDSADDFHRFLELDVSASELADRARNAVDRALTVDQTQRETLAAFGIDTGDLAAYFLDPKRALPELEKKYEVGLLAAERKRAYGSYDEAFAEEMYGAGVSSAQAREGYGNIAQYLDTTEKLGEIYGDSFTLRDAERSEFLDDGQATKKRRTLASQERAAFSGRAGTSGSTLSRDDRFK